MKTLHLFKISLDSKKFDVVEMIYDEIEEVYIVRWKWSSMTKTMSITFRTWEEALAMFNERKTFAKVCN